MQEALIKALDVIRAGGIILYPTDTVWGLGCDATNAAAIGRIYDLKQKNDKKGLINSFYPYPFGASHTAS